MSLACPEPRFSYVGGWWSPCTACGRLAWDHEQSDMNQDVRNYMKAAVEGLSPGDFPPSMRSATTDGEPR